LVALRIIAHVGDYGDGTPLTLADLHHLQTEEETFLQSRDIYDTEHVLNIWIDE